MDCRVPSPPRLRRATSSLGCRSFSEGGKPGNDKISSQDAFSDARWLLNTRRRRKSVFLRRASPAFVDRRLPAIVPAGDASLLASILVADHKSPATCDALVAILRADILAEQLALDAILLGGSGPGQIQEYRNGKCEDNNASHGVPVGSSRAPSHVMRASAIKL